MGRAICLVLFISTLCLVSGYKDYLKYISLDEIEDGSTYSFNEYDNSLTRIDSTNCTKAGPICDGCDSTYECIEIGSGFIIEFLDYCPAGSACLESTGKCTTNHNPTCDTIGYNFTCRQVGFFPDAFNCQKYHICVTVGSSNTVRAQSIVQRCGLDFYYDPKTALCRNKLVEDDCPPVAPPCQAAGDTGVVASNPALYYICLKGEGDANFSPQMLSCLNNNVYDAKNKLCVDPTPSKGTGSDGRCNAVGKFYDATNVFNYIECAQIGNTPTSQSCSARTRFDPISQDCVDITWGDFEYYKDTFDNQL